MAHELPSNPDEGEQPTSGDVDKYLDRLEHQIIGDSSGVFHADAMSEQHRELSRAYYEKACAKARMFVEGLDPNLAVSVSEVSVQPADTTRQKYRTYVLRFLHRTKTDLQWTMEIEENDKYIETQFEEVVKEIYWRKALESKG